MWALIENNRLWILLSIGAIFTMMWVMLLRKRLKISWYAAILISVLLVLCGVICVKVFARLEGGNSGAMSLFGVVFIMPFVYYAIARLTNNSIAEVFDIFTIPMVFTVMCARINCLLAGCCQGRIIIGTDIRWPTREVELLFYLLFLVLMIPKVRNNRMKGIVYPVYMASYGGFRFIIEFFREAASNSIFHLAHVWAMIAFALGISVYIELRNRSNKRELSYMKRRK